MAVPRLPDWVIYGAVVSALLLVCATGRERADAPPAPPVPEGGEGALTGLPPGFEHTIAVDTTSGPGAPPLGAAFSVSASGRWITAARLVKGCRKAAILLGGGQALEAAVTQAHDADTAVLTTAIAGPALPVATAAQVRVGERGFQPGYPHGQAGELTTRLIGSRTLRPETRGAPVETVASWALVGRTQGLHGSLAGLIGGPVLDAQGRVVGVTLTESRRRGRIYATPVPSLTPGPASRTAPREPAPGQPVTLENYGRVADGLRRDLRVAEVRCL
jgi:S1-C subfamily serine protease